MGAMLKSTFSIQNIDKIYTSQYLGNLTSFDTELNFKQALEQLTGILQHNPEVVLCDYHTDYPSSRIGEEIANELDLPLVRIHHHEAHFAAVLGENGLTQSESPVLGVIWDGLGLGHDDQIWGVLFTKKPH